MGGGADFESLLSKHRSLVAEDAEKMASNLYGDEDEEEDSDDGARGDDDGSISHQ